MSVAVAIVFFPLLWDIISHLKTLPLDFCYHCSLWGQTLNTVRVFLYSFWMGDQPSSTCCAMDLPEDDDGMSIGNLMGVAPFKVEAPPPVVAAVSELPALAAGVSELPAAVEEDKLTTHRQKRRLGAEKHVVKLFYVGSPSL